MPEAGTVVADAQPELPLPIPEGDQDTTVVAEGDQDAVVQDTGDQATPTKPEGEKPEVTEEKDEPTPEQAAKRESRRFERRLDKAYRKAAEAQARADAAERRLAEFDKPAAPEGMPKLEDFDYDTDKFAAAISEHATAKAAEKLKADQEQQTNERINTQLVNEWDRKVEAVDSKYEDFAQVVGEIVPDSAFAAAIMDADNGPDIAYYLAKNEKEFDRIQAMKNPIAQVRELGRLQAKLEATPVKPKVPSKAPAPITPLSGDSATPNAGEPSDDDNIDAWMDKRNKQVHKAG